MPVEVLDGVENPILVVHQPIQCIAGAVGLGMRESFLELGGFVAQLEYGCKSNLLVSGTF